MILNSNLSRSEQRYQEKKDKIKRLITQLRTKERQLELSYKHKIEASKFGKEVISLSQELLREKNLVKNILINIYYINILFNLEQSTY
jgi:hypothetical protein